MKKMYSVCLSLFAALVLSSCGGEGSKAPNNPLAVNTSKISEGKYFLSAGLVEAFDNNGNKLDPQSLQITGEYTWTFKHLGSEKYEIIATGNAKISNSNVVLSELNCKGAQDTYSFELVDGRVVRNLKQIETGCPQGLKPNSAQQLTLEVLSNQAISYVVSTQGNNVRTVENYTFKK